MAKFGIAAVLLAALLLGAWALRRERPAETPRKPRHEHRNCAHAPAEPVKTATREEVAKTESEFAARLREPADPDELRAWIAAELSEGRLAPAAVVARMLAEKDMGILDVLMGVLRADPPQANRPEVIAAFVEMTRHPSRDHRQVAAAFLAESWDRDGAVCRALLDLARAEPDTDVRLTAISAFGEFTVKNPSAAPAVNDELLRLASTNEGAVRAMSLGSLNMVEATDEVLRDLATHVADASLDVRVAVYEKLGQAREAHRPAARATLEAARSRENTEIGRQQIDAAFNKNHR